MIKVELTKSRSPKRKYRLRIDDKLFIQDTSKRGIPRLVIDSSTPESIHLQVKGLAISKKIAEHTFNEIPREITSIAFVGEDSICLHSNLIEPINYVACERTSNWYFELSWTMLPYREAWSAPYSVVEFVGEFYRRLRRHYQIRFLDHNERGFEGDELWLAIRVQM